MSVVDDAADPVVFKGQMANVGPVREEQGRVPFIRLAPRPIPGVFAVAFVALALESALLVDADLRTDTVHQALVHI